MASRKIPRVLLWVGVPLAIYAGVVLLVWAFQERLIFVGAGFGRGARVPSIPGVRIAELPGADGAFRVAIGGPRAAPRGVLAFFVGNGEDLRSGAWHAGELAAYGLEVWVPEYPGYGDSQGSPSRDSLLAAAAVLVAHAEKRADELGVPLLAGGSSLGSFCAMHVAARAPVERLLLRAPPTTLVDAARKHYPWLPVGWFLRHRFDNLAEARSVHCPVLVIHGERDRVVPVAMGRALANALGERARFVPAPGYGHNDLPLSREGPFGTLLAEFLTGG